MFIRKRGNKSSFSGKEGNMESTPLAVAEEGGAAAASLSLADVEMQSVGKKRAVPVSASAYSAAKKGMGLISTITYCLFGGTIVACSMAMTIYSSPLIQAACSISIILSVYGLDQRRRLDRMDTLRAALNKVRAEVNRMMTENDKLTHENNKLEAEANRVKDMENRLNGILSSQGKDVAAFVSKVKENQAVLDEIKGCMKAQVSQDIVTVLMNADRDEDCIIDPEEVKGLLFRLRAFDGLDVNEDKFRFLLEKKGNSIDAVVGLVKDLMDDEPNDDTVFTVNTKQLSRGSFRV